MKIRNGFVTNSSSSSFIVATTSSGGEAFLDMIRFLMDHNSGYDYDVKTVFPEEEIQKGNWTQWSFAEAMNMANELKTKNVYEVTIENNEVVEIMRKAGQTINGFEVVCEEYA